MDNYLSKEDTKALKGIAIIFMLINHLWGDPTRIYGGELMAVISLGYTSLPSILGHFGGICVTFFFFLGGYGMYKLFEGKKYDIVGRLKALYFSYWKVFLIFIPIGFLLFRNQPVYCDDATVCDRFLQFNVKEFITSFFGFSSNYNFSWWFFEKYVIALLLFPIARRVINKVSTPVSVGLIVVVSILMANVFPALGNLEALGILNENFLFTSFFSTPHIGLGCFFMGMLAAKAGLLDRLSDALRSNRLLNPFTDIIIFAMVIFFRQDVVGMEWDLFLVPMLIVAFKDLLDRMKLLRKGFMAIGKESTNMWLIHAFFCSFFYPVAKLVTASGWALISLVTLFVFSFIASLATTYLWKGIEFIYRKFTCHQK